MSKWKATTFEDRLLRAPITIYTKNSFIENSKDANIGLIEAIKGLFITNILLIFVAFLVGQISKMSSGPFSIDISFMKSLIILLGITDILVILLIISNVFRKLGL